MPILGPLLNALHGFDFYVAVVGFAICIILWVRAGANKTEQKRLKKQIKAIIIPVMLVIVVIGIHHVIPQKRFPNDIAGILVLKIAGDADGSLQRELVSSLNDRLANDTNSQPIEVWADNNVVDERQGLVEAHNEAREFGKKRNALLVVWGSKVGEMRFFPRITVVPNPNSQGDCTLKVQDIRTLDLPPETVNQPIYMAQCLVGFICYISNQYEQALSHFLAALQMNQGTGQEIASLHMIIGAIQCGLAQNSINSTTQVRTAIENLALAADYYEQNGQSNEFASAEGFLGIAYFSLDRGNDEENTIVAINDLKIDLAFADHDSPQDQAMTESDIAALYCILPTGDRTTNIEYAISLSQGAAKIVTKNDTNVWAQIHNNLGYAYLELPAGNRRENTQMAIAACRSSLEVASETVSPYDWAEAQLNLGVAYQQSGDTSDSILAFKSALEVYTKYGTPFNWAKTENNLGAAYLDLSQDQGEKYIYLAMESLDSALEVYNETNSPHGWAMAQVNLGNVYKTLSAVDGSYNITNAFKRYLGALRVINETNYPNDYADILVNLGEMSATLPFGDKEKNYRFSIEAFQEALKSSDRKLYPEKWAEIQSDVALTYLASPVGDHTTNVNESIQASKLALQVFNRVDSPDDWASAEAVLGEGYFSLATQGDTNVLNEALASFLAALSVADERRHPFLWAKLQNDLGNVYLLSTAGSQLDNLRQAISMYQASLEVFNETDSPSSWAISQMNMGTAYSFMTNENKSENFKRARQHFVNALEIFTPDNAPSFYRNVTNGLNRVKIANRSN